MSSLKIFAILLTLGLLIGVLLLAVPASAEAAKTPPQITALVKFRKALNYDEGHGMTGLQRWRAVRNYNNSISKNYRAKKVTEKLHVAFWLADHGRYRAAQNKINQAIDLAWQYRRATTQ